MGNLWEASSRFRRREIIKAIPVAFASHSFARAFAASTSTGPTRNFPSEPRARLAVTSYPFRGFINSPTNRGRDPKLPGMDLKEFPAFVAEKFNVRNINPLLDHFSSADPAYIDAFRAALERAHSQIVGLGLGGKRFYARDAAIRRDAILFSKKCIDVAVQVGSPSVRQHVAGHAGENPDVSLAAGCLGQVAEYGAKRNIVINLENDSPGSEDPYFLVAVIEKVKNPYLRALPDFGNSLVGHEDSYNRDAVKTMLQHAWNMCHVKDTVRGHDGKVYHVDLPSMFALARATAYRGYFSMEFDTHGGDPVTGTKKLVEATLRYLT